MAKNIKRSAIGERLVKLRNDNPHYKNQQDVANALGIKRDTYARYETGTIPPVSIMEKLSELYDETIDYIIKGTNSKHAVKQSSGEIIPEKETVTPKVFRQFIGYNTDNPDRTITLSDEEIELVDRFRELSQTKKEAVLTILDKEL